ncbi:Ubiquitin recognition factor in ER-associated degradation protein 1 [Balamuthia mandrillaris]
MSLIDLTNLLMRPPQGTFERQYRAHSVAYVGKEHLENGGKIILPPTALDTLARLSIDYPMLFQLTGAHGQRTHCGVLEFVAEEGFCYLPYWMMQQLLLVEGQLITVKSTTLPKGSYVKLQPTDDSFLEISNPRAVLENALRNWAALTKDDVICIKYNNKNYYLTVLEVKPDSTNHGISIIETDVVVDFAASPEAIAREKKEAEEKARQALKQVAAASAPQGSSSSDQAQAAVKEAPRFPGTGQRLNGKPVDEPPSSSPSSSSSRTAAPPLRTSSSSASSSQQPQQQQQPLRTSKGGMLFGRPAAPPTSNDKGKEKEGAPKSSSAATTTKERFPGKGYSLK